MIYLYLVVCTAVGLAVIWFADGGLYSQMQFYLKKNSADNRAYRFTKPIRLGLSALFSVCFSITYLWDLGGGFGTACAVLVLALIGYTVTDAINS